MVLVKSKPAHSFFNDSFMPSVFNSFFNEYHPAGSDDWFRPQSNIVEKEKQFEISMALPGIKKEDVKISIEHDKLVVSGERKAETLADTDTLHRREMYYGKFSRTFNLGKVSRDKIEASFADGMLYISLPKAEESMPSTIEIK